LGGTRLTLLILLVGTGLSVAVERAYRSDRLREERAAVTGTAAGLANAVSVAVNHRMALLNGLRALVEVTWGRGGFAADFTAYASRLHGSIPGIRSVQWVQDGVIRQTYPTGGNERAIGYRLTDDPRPFIVEDYRRAEAGTGIVISGPTDLVQGGLGLIARTPARDSAGGLLAVVAVVLDLPPILAEAGLGADPALRVALHSRDGAVFAGEAGVLSGNPVVREVPLAEGTWTLAVVPAAGWGAALRPRLAVVRVTLATLVALAALVGWLAAGRARARAREKEERERRRGEEKFSRLFALSPDGALLSRVSDGLILEANEGAVATLGYSRAELLGRSALDLGIWVNPADRDQAIMLMRQRGVLRNFPARFRTGDGRLREGLYAGRVIEVDGEPCLLSLFRDVTDQKELEAQLAHAQKLEAVGRLAGGIAHDFNNLVTAITGYGELLRSGLAAEDPRRADAEEILRAAGRAAGLTQQLLAFGRRQLAQPRVIDLNQLVGELDKLLQRLAGEQVAVVTELAEEVVPVHVDPGQFEQVLVNLVVNARDAMPGGGRVLIRTRIVGAEAVLEVSDEGDGMTEEVQARAFEPFFTTKARGKGTGLGLATVYGIVQQSAGRIDLTSEPGQGTRFVITLPRAEGEPQPLAADGRPGVSRGGRERIVLAEDDAQVRRLAERTLAAAGYTVQACADGEQCLAAVRDGSPGPDLLVTDLVMPGIGGHQLARRCRELAPGLRVLFVSGYTDDVAERQGLVGAGQAFLPKPFTPAELVARVREILDSPAPG